jgi:hypothetical protein
VYKQILINAKLQIAKRGQKTELTGRSPLGRQRSTLDYSASEEEPTALYQFLLAKEGYIRAVCATFRNLILLGGKKVSEKALSSFAASVYNKQETISGLHLYIHYLNFHYVTSFINYLRMCKTINFIRKFCFWSGMKLDQIPMM